MTPKKAAKKAATKPAKVAKKSAKKSEVWSDDERAVMKEHARDMKRAKSGKVDGESELLAKVAEMSEPDRGMATRIHALIKTAAPELKAKTWYGMPAWASAEGKVVCFFQAAIKFKARYATFGFSDEAKLDEGDMWPTSFGLKKLTPADEKRIVALVKKAVGRS